jgi:hypothetical protein
MRYCFGHRTIARHSLAYPENDHQLSLNSVRSSIFGNQDVAQIFACIKVLLTTLTGENTKYHRQKTDTKLIDIANCTSCKSELMVVVNAFLIRHYKQTTNTRAKYDSIDGPAG